MLFENFFFFSLSHGNLTQPVKPVTTVHFVKQKEPTSPIIWFNLTEDMQLFVNNKPYVLREMAYPFKFWQPFARISGQKIDELESRLKQEFSNEAKQVRLLQTEAFSLSCLFSEFGKKKIEYRSFKIDCYFMTKHKIRN